jgi:hypothetical protein
MRRKRDSLKAKSPGKLSYLAVFRGERKSAGTGVITRSLWHFMTKSAILLTALRGLGDGGLRSWFFLAIDEVSFQALVIADSQPAGHAHPGLQPHVHQPILHGGDPAQVLTDMLFPNRANRNDPAIAVGDRGAEDCLSKEDALRVVPQGPMPQVGQALFRFVEELMNRLIISGLAAPALDAGQTMVERVCDDLPPRKHGSRECDFRCI